MYGDFQGVNQVMECINSSLLSIFLIDENQKVTLKDIGSEELIKKYARELDAGMAYLIQNGYPNKSFTGDASKDTYITPFCDSSRNFPSIIPRKYEHTLTILKKTERTVKFPRFFSCFQEDISSKFLKMLSGE